MGLKPYNVRERHGIVIETDEPDENGSKGYGGVHLRRSGCYGGMTSTSLQSGG